MLFIQFLGKYIFMKVIGNDEPVTVSNDFPNGYSYNQFARLDIVDIFKYYG